MTGIQKADKCVRYMDGGSFECVFKIVFLQVLGQINKKKGALNKVPCDNIDNCSSWRQIKLCMIYIDKIPYFHQ